MVVGWVVVVCRVVVVFASVVVVVCDDDERVPVPAPMASVVDVVELDVVVDAPVDLDVRSDLVDTPRFRARSRANRSL